jgi:hypothetical protein
MLEIILPRVQGLDFRGINVKPKHGKPNPMEGGKQGEPDIAEPDDPNHRGFAFYFVEELHVAGMYRTRGWEIQ